MEIGSLFNMLRKQYEDCTNASPQKIVEIENKNGKLTISVKHF